MQGACTRPIPILVRLGYFIFLLHRIFLLGLFSSDYNLIHGAKGFASLVTPRPERAVIVLFENSRILPDLTVQPKRMTANSHGQTWIRITS